MEAQERNQIVHIWDNYQQYICFPESDFTEIIVIVNDA